MIKRITLCLLAVATVSGAFAQERQNYRNERQWQQNTEQSDTLKSRKGSYLSVSGSLGASDLKYDLKGLKENGTRDSKLGYGFEVKYSYFFNEHWGVTTGVGVSQYASVGKLKGSMDAETFYSLGNFTDDDLIERPIDFELRTRITNLEEKQTVWLLDVPVMLSYQTYFGDSARWGIYGGVGAKLQFPVSSKFKIQNGGSSEFNVSGKYDGIPTDMGAPGNPPVPQHGYGTITDPNSSLNWDDKAKLKMGIAATAELGFLFDIGKGMDLMIGGYVDYGLNDIKKKGDNKIFTASSAYHPGADGQVGKGIKYHGMLNSNATDKVKLLSFGAKLGLRFKL